MATAPMTYADLFRAAVGSRPGQPVPDPYPYQGAFAEARDLLALARVPTGLGKTAMAILGWIWRRRYAADAICKITPRRLIYCLPMRVLVEQTRDSAKAWLENLGISSGVGIHVLMGGEEVDDWDLHPERDAVIIGTQDMLLSRALNRGYAMTRYRWPMHFALLNNDALWIMDEVQLMGSGLITTAQLHSFRSTLGTQGAVQSVWMSATLDPDWLRTVDLDPASLGVPLELSGADLAMPEVRDRYRASKRLGKAEATAAWPAALAEEILKAHEVGTRTLVVVNTVERARRLAGEIGKRLRAVAAAPDLVLIHSRFRPGDRARHVRRLLDQPSAAGTVIVATQVVEAGVDVSSRTLFTELAPWASLVQRFGRCNRKGEFGAGDPSKVRWIDLDLLEEGGARPYPPHELRTSRDKLVELEGRSVSPEMLDRLGVKLPYECLHVIRQKDVIELFDTTPDLAGNNLDIDRYVRDVEETDVRVFWRDLGRRPPEPDEPLPFRDELCPVPIGAFRKFVDKLATKDQRAHSRNFLERRWDAVLATAIAPGQMYMLDSSAGGYDPETGWMGEPARKTANHVAPVGAPTHNPALEDDGNEADRLSQSERWQTIAEHTDEVCRELERLLGVVQASYGNALRVAARWHDWGKAHHVFQQAIPDNPPRPDEVWAKARGKWKRYSRRQFRHELASAIALLGVAAETLRLPTTGAVAGGLPQDAGLEARELQDLAAYLVAAHHGKVRLSIRSFPREHHPPDGKRFARGIWEGDHLPAMDLGDGVMTPDVWVSLEPMEMGLCQEPPFAGQPSWAARMVRLRDRLGPFRLSYLEALLRAGDMQASASKQASAHAPGRR